MPMLRSKAPDLLGRQCDNPAFLAITGSRLYGAERYDEHGECVSDTDYRGFIVPSWEYLVRLPSPKKEWDVMDYDDGDHVIYNIRWFIATLLGCNPQLIECLFAPKSHIVACNAYGRALLDCRDAFACKRFYRRMTGFGNSEWRKARGVKDLMPKRVNTERAIIESIRNVFGVHWTDPEVAKDNMDQIEAVLFSGHERQQVSSMDGISKKRRFEFDLYGYGVSSACHSLRLMQQCAEFMRTGSMTFPRNNAYLLREIKQGKHPFVDVEKMYLEAREDCDAAYAESKLPAEPDVEKIKTLYHRIVATALNNDEGLKRAEMLSLAEA